MVKSDQATRFFRRHHKTESTMETLLTGEAAEFLFKALHPVVQCDGLPMSADLWADSGGYIYLRKIRITGGRIELLSLQFINANENSGWEL